MSIGSEVKRIQLLSPDAFGIKLHELPFRRELPIAIIDPMWQMAVNGYVMLFKTQFIRTIESLRDSGYVLLLPPVEPVFSDGVDKIIVETHTSKVINEKEWKGLPHSWLLYKNREDARLNRLRAFIPHAKAVALLPQYDVTVLCSWREKPIFDTVGIANALWESSSNTALGARSRRRKLSWIAEIDHLLRVFLFFSPLVLAIIVRVFRQEFNAFALIVIRTFPTWVLALIIAFAGAILYLIRSRQRILYGMVEFLVGWWIAYEAVPAQIGTDLLNSMLSILLSLYIIVRGLDNIGKGLSKTRYDAVWRRLFGDDYK